MTTILSHEDWARLQEFFANASEMDQVSRQQYLDSIGAEWPVLRARVEALLATLDSDTGLHRMVGEAVAGIADAELPAIGVMVGPYRLTGILGRGGMGVVYRAIRADDAYQMEVAIKVASFGVYVPELRDRFMSERRILANLEHPNIARIIDGGTTSQGAPYVAMELVSGKPIDQWCQDANLSIADRVRLFLEVLAAVEHAHQHLVVHRDLKPDNILVNAQGEPKLLDFGIAKALDPQALGVDSGQTVDTSRLMTPSYASPEQVRGEVVTTRTDVYQLGVLLYLLATGKLPFAVSNLRMAEIERLICDTPPPRPQVEEDLSRIILHAIEKDPQRRYAGARAFSDDLRRWLNGFPVRARQSSWMYRARKFAGRHRLAVAAASIGFCLTVVFVGALIVQSRRLERERNAAQRAAEFLASVFAAANTSQALGKTISPRELLDKGAAGVGQVADLDPVAQDKLLTTLADDYLSQGIYDRAYAMQSKSLQLRRTVYGENSPQVAESMGKLADLDLYSEDYQRAFSDADTWFRHIRPLDDRYDEEALRALRVRSTNEIYRNQLAAAEATLRQVLRVDERIGALGRDSIHGDEPSLGVVLYYEGKWQDVEQVERDGYNYFHRGDWQNQSSVITELEMATRLGFLLGQEGRYAEAVPMLRETVALRLKILGFAHDSTGATEAILGATLGRMGQYREAEKWGLDALHSRQAAMGGTSRNYGVDEGMLAGTYLNEGKLELAEPLIEDDIRLCASHLPGESFFMARALTLRARLQLGRGQSTAAAETLRQALATEQKLVGDTTPFAALDHSLLGQALAAQGDLTEAEVQLRRAVELYGTTAAGDRQGAADSLLALAKLLERRGAPAEAGQARVKAAGLKRELTAEIAMAVRQN